ncbi:MAG: hypothetical protein ACC651_14865, partial [Candidatus Scalindua sp.]
IIGRSKVRVLPGPPFISIQFIRLRDFYTWTHGLLVGGSKLAKQAYTRVYCCQLSTVRPDPAAFVKLYLAVFPVQSLAGIYSLTTFTEGDIQDWLNFNPSL